MAKRFTDAEKWDDPFFMDMPDKFKLAYIFILDKCDQVGVWKVNRRSVEFYVGELDWDLFVSYMGKRVYHINDEKWWLTKSKHRDYTNRIRYDDGQIPGVDLCKYAMREFYSYRSIMKRLGIPRKNNLFPLVMNLVINARIKKSFASSV